MPEITTYNKAKPTKAHKIPAYILGFYKRFYIHSKWFNFFDTNWFAWLSTFGQYSKIKKSLLKEIPASSSVLIVGNNYGNLIKDIAGKIGDEGSLEIIDTIPLQTELVKYKISPWPSFQTHISDIEFFDSVNKYDRIICYFLLHEMPDSKKIKSILNMLSLLKKDGKVNIIDYAPAHKYHPLSKIMIYLNRLVEPFAETMQTTSLKELLHKANISEDNSGITFTGTYFLGKLYQKTTISIRSSE